MPLVNLTPGALKRSWSGERVTLGVMIGLLLEGAALTTALKKAIAEFPGEGSPAGDISLSYY